MCALAEVTADDRAVDFIDDARLEGLLAGGRPAPAQVRETIAKALAKEPLSEAEAAVLVRADDPAMVEEIFEAARRLKRRIYGNRIVLFAPLYVGNLCVNDCRYCGFRRTSAEAVRRTLGQDALRGEVRALAEAGHKRLILVFGEHPRYDAAFIARCVRTVYETKAGPGFATAKPGFARAQPGEIRRVNINAAPLDHAGYRALKQAGIGTYQIFMETYHHATYARMHPRGTRKADYLWRLGGVGRAIEAGSGDVGIGALFGLYDWRFDLLGLVRHARELQARYGVGPHTISFPRLRPAAGAAVDPARRASDADLKRLIAILRLAVPYTGLILTAREPPEVRREAIALGVSQIDAGSRIAIGGYARAAGGQAAERQQFTLGDTRSLDEVMRELLTDGYVPSFCTACYRRGRTGEDFMELAMPGSIEQFCTPNALLTLAEYVADYASPRTAQAARTRIGEELAAVREGPRKRALVERLRRIETEGERDVCF